MSEKLHIIFLSYITTHYIRKTKIKNKSVFISQVLYTQITLIIIFCFITKTKDERKMNNKIKLKIVKRKLGKSNKTTKNHNTHKSFNLISSHKHQTRTQRQK